MLPIVLYDGHCNLCSRSVRFVLTHEAAPSLRFAAIQSPVGQRLVRQHGLAASAVETVVFVEADTAFVRSDAAVRIARHLRWPWRFLVAARLVPRALRDRVYDFVASRRYRWFGRRGTCLVMIPELAERFLGDEPRCDDTGDR